jgi:NAD(P)-dependent dehydrogenase (short-subunit alcohol dehydrogenase family)
MIALVSEAEDYLARQATVTLPSSAADNTFDAHSVANGSGERRVNITALRRAVSDAAGVPLLMKVRTDAQAIEFSRRTDLAKLTQQGPATPDHVIRTKRIPLLGRDVATYASAYRQYFADYGDASLSMLDPAPRVILDPIFGLCSVGRTAKDASIVEDIYLHTMDIIVQASALGGWHALPPRDIFEVEYWDLEQQKLRRASPAALFAGEAALVTGAASGIGKACVTSLLARGAAVVGLDIDLAVENLHQRPDYLGISCDLTSELQVTQALDRAVHAFGGVDLLILNAGVFPASRPIAELPSDLWRKTLSINLDANLVLLRESYACLKLAPRGGRVVLIGSKNVAAPGPGAAAYSASKAALQQLARVAALEWGHDQIRVNTLHPNAVFDTALWTPTVLAARAASYGVSVEQYKTSNVLQVEVSSRDVAELAAELCGPLFAKTTGAQIPVDGGLQRVI